MPSSVAFHDKFPTKIVVAAQAQWICQAWTHVHTYDKEWLEKKHCVGRKTGCAEAEQ
jgi:hypothetical protein